MQIVLGLDGGLQNVPGVLMSAIFALGNGLTLVCPNGSGNEARLAGPELSLIAPKNLQEIVGFAKGTHIIEDNFECETEDENYQFDMSDVFDCEFFYLFLYL